MKRFEKNKDVEDTGTFSLATSIVLLPAASGAALPLGAAAGGISTLIIDNNLGSKEIQNALDNSTSKKFKIKIKYQKGSRGQDKWYSPVAASVKPA